MPKLALSATTTTTVEVKLKPHVRQMVRQRIEEHQKLATEVKSRKTRMKVIDGEVTTLFKKEKQGQALLDGTKLDGHGLKLTIGKTKRFDQKGFMKKHGLLQEDFNEFTEYTDNEPYVRFTHPGEKEDEE